MKQSIINVRKKYINGIDALTDGKVPDSQWMKNIVSSWILENPIIVYLYIYSAAMPFSDVTSTELDWIIAKSGISSHSSFKAVKEAAEWPAFKRCLIWHQLWPQVLHSVRVGRLCDRFKALILTGENWATFTRAPDRSLAQLTSLQIDDKLGSNKLL